MLDWMEQITHVTVNDMYKYAKHSDVPMLALDSTNFDFWADYKSHYQDYDIIFNRMFKGFYYFDQEEDEEVQNVLATFKADVNAMLRMNAKRYSELWRVHVVDDTSYSIIDNYDVTETKEGEGARDITDNIGAKTSNSSVNVGAKDKTVTDNIGAKSITNNSTTGQQTNTGTEKVSPYDTDTFNNDNQFEQVAGSRTDTGTSTEQARTDTSRTQEQAHTDTTQTTESARTNTRGEESSESYNLHRKGNIGTMTQSDVMRKHVDFWTSFDFYRLVFNDICKEMLLIEKGYIV